MFIRAYETEKDILIERRKIMFNEEITVEEIRSSVTTLDKDLRNAASTMTDDEARFLVDSYYQMQANRIRSNNQIRQMKDEPHDILYWLSTQATVLEKISNQHLMCIPTPIQ